MYDAFGARQLVALKAAPRTLGVQLQLVEVRSPYDYNAAFKGATKNKADAMMVLSSPHFYVARDQIAKLALRYKLPTVCQSDPLVRAGGLISYGPDQLATFGRTAYFVDRVLKGASPAGLPIEQPTQYFLVVNLKTAKALGNTIPQSTLLRADEVIRRRVAIGVQRSLRMRGPESIATRQWQCHQLKVLSGASGRQTLPERTAGLGLVFVSK